MCETKTTNKEKVVKVFTEEGKYLSSCTKKRAKKLVFQKKAVWRAYNELTLLVLPEDKKRFREEVLKRDGMICYICEKQLTREEVTFDHIIPRKQGGSESADNLAVCCESCNKHKADRTPEQYMLYLFYRILLYLNFPTTAS